MICGIDEAGRGPLAGPVYAAAVVLASEASPLPGVKDSKKLSATARDRLEALVKDHAIAWAVASADVEEIDRLDILGATMLAMTRAHAALAGAVANLRSVVIDGTHRPEALVNWARSHGIEARAQARADVDVVAVAAASILAKTARDRHMIALDRQHPGYGFAVHKGYGTAMHMAALARLGPCAAHRRSFAPVRRYDSGA